MESVAWLEAGKGLDSETPQETLHYFLPFLNWFPHIPANAAKGFKSIAHPPFLSIMTVAYFLSCAVSNH
jgi:hypothetical protein